MELAQLVPPSEFLEYIKGLGAAGGPIFFFLWLMEYRRNEREREKTDSALERSIAAMAEMKVTAQTLASIFNPGK